MPTSVWGMTDWYGRLGYDSRRRAASRTRCWRGVCFGGGCARQFCTAVLSAGVECCELCKGMQGSGSSEYRSEENETKIPNVCPHLIVETRGGRAVGCPGQFDGMPRHGFNF